MIVCQRDLFEGQKNMYENDACFSIPAIKFDKNVFKSAKEVLRHSEIVKAEREGMPDVYLYYTEDYVKYGPQRKIKLSANYECEDLCEEIQYLDTTLLLRDGKVTTYVFFKLDEYTSAITELLNRYYKNIRVIFLDPLARNLFGERIEYYEELSDICFNNDEYVVKVVSDMEYLDEFKTLPGQDILSSVVLMNSLCWCKKRRQLGNLNKDRTILVIDVEFGHGEGLGDIVKIVNSLLILSKRRKFTPFIALTGNNQYVSDGKDMWSNYFEKGSSLTMAEVMKSNEVIFLSDNDFKAEFVWVMPYLRYDILRKNELLSINKNVLNRMSEKLCSLGVGNSERILGVIARGSDTSIGRKTFQRMAMMAYNCRKVFERYNFKHLFLATEDIDYWNAFHKEFDNGEIIEIDQIRTEYNYTEQNYKVVADLINVDDQNRTKWGETYLMITYALSLCDCLIYNVDAGTYHLSKLWKKQRGEAFEWTKFYNEVDGASLKESLRYMINNASMKCERLIIYGTGGNGRMLIPYLTGYRGEILYSDQKAENGEYDFCGYRVIAPSVIKKKYLTDKTAVIVTVVAYEKQIYDEFVSAGANSEMIMLL